MNKFEIIEHRLTAVERARTRLQKAEAGMNSAEGELRAARMDFWRVVGQPPPRVLTFRDKRFNQELFEIAAVLVVGIGLWSLMLAIIAPIIWGAFLVCVGALAFWLWTKWNSAKVLGGKWIADAP